MVLNGQSVVVTGGAGFIGSHLSDSLLAAGAQVLVIDDLSTCGHQNIHHLSDHPKFAVEEADVRDGDAMTTLIAHADIVFHLATRNVRLSLRRPTEVHEVNTDGTYNVLTAASAGRAKRFVYCSSSEVHGTAREVPLREDSACHPETIYGASKLAGEFYTNAFHRSGWLDCVIVRPHNTYGPREHFLGHHGEVIPRFILLSLAGRAPTIFGDGKQTRDFTYVGDTAAFLIRLGIHDAASGGTFNLCRGIEVSILELAKHITTITGLNALPELRPGRPADVLRLLGDPTRLRALLGSSPQTMIENGLATTTRWFKENVEITESLIDDLDDANWEVVEQEPWLPGK